MTTRLSTLGQPGDWRAGRVPKFQIPALVACHVEFIAKSQRRQGRVDGMARPKPTWIAQVDVLQREHFVIEEDTRFLRRLPGELTAEYGGAFQRFRQGRADIATVKDGQRLAGAGYADIKSPALFLLLRALDRQPPRADEQDMVKFGAFGGMDRA